MITLENMQRKQTPENDYSMWYGIEIDILYLIAAKNAVEIIICAKIKRNDRFRIFQFFTRLLYKV